MRSLNSDIAGVLIVKKRQCHDNRWFLAAILCGEKQWRPQVKAAEYDNCSTQLGRWSWSRGWPSCYGLIFATLAQAVPIFFVIFGRRALIFFCLKALGKKWKMTPLLCACAVVITLETQKCRKRAPRSVELNFFNNCDRQKRFSQNERRRVDLQNLPQIF